MNEDSQGNRIGRSILMTIVLCGIVYCFMLAGAYFSGRLDGPHNPTDCAFADKAAAARQITMYKQLVLSGFVLLGTILYTLRLAKLRLFIGAVSIGIIGCWLTVIPGTADFLRIFENSSWFKPLIIGPIVILIITILFGRVYCGYICPVGLLLELSGKVGPKLLAEKEKHLQMRWIKYKVLVLMLAALAWGWNEVTVFEPFGLYATLIGAGIAAWIFAIALLISGILGGRVWCMYLCPVGGVLAVFSRYCLFPKKTVCKGCTILRTKKNLEGECLRCLQNQ